MCVRVYNNNEKRGYATERESGAHRKNWWQKREEIHDVNTILIYEILKSNLGRINDEQLTSEVV